MSYIGVTGFVHADQVREALSVVPSDATRQLMIGVHASYDSVYGCTTGRRLPSRTDISGIFRTHLHALNLVHYTTGTREDLAAQLWDVLQWAGPLCDGVQLNIVWPDPAAVEGLRRSRPRTVIVLQVNRPMMRSCDFDVIRLAQRVTHEYGRLVDYVLVDASGGRAEELDISFSSAYLLELREALDIVGCESVGLVVAGGFDARAVRLKMPILHTLVDAIGIDAEGRLRSADDRMDMAAVRDYVAAAYEILDS